MATEKWISVKAIQLGMIKRNISVGTIILHDPETHHLEIDGIPFNTDTDLLILKKANWVVPFTKENVEIVKNMSPMKKAQKIDENDIKKYPVVAENENGDEDMIDISGTKKAVEKKNVKTVTAREKLNAINYSERQVEEAVLKRPMNIIDTPEDEDQSIGNVASIQKTVLKNHTPEQLAEMRAENQRKITAKYGKGPETAMKNALNIEDLPSGNIQTKEVLSGIADVSENKTIAKEQIETSITSAPALASTIKGGSHTPEELAAMREEAQRKIDAKYKKVAPVPVVTPVVPSVKKKGRPAGSKNKVKNKPEAPTA